MAIDERLWGIMAKRLGYSEAEAEQFRSDPRNAQVLEKAAEIQKARLVLEVVESHGCASRHAVGDRIVFDGAGNLLAESSPKKIRGYALANSLMLIYAANEMIYAGIDPNEMRFRRASCFDVGLQCGGWGHVVFELHAEEQGS